MKKGIIILKKQFADRLIEIEYAEDLITDNGKGYILYFKDNWYYNNEYSSWLACNLKECKEVLKELEYKRK